MSNFDRNPNSFLGQPISQTSGIGSQDQGLRAYMLGVYNYMAAGLVLTGIVAYITFYMAVDHSSGGRIALTAFGEAIYLSPLKWLVMLAPLGLCFFFSYRLASMQAETARALFLVFAASMGLSISSILMIYTGESIARVFFITAASFAALSFYGYTTPRSLSAMGSFMAMGVWGLIIASVVNIFFQSSAMQWTISALAVVIFAGLTAWDTQAIKQIYYAGDGYEVSTKKSIQGALMLYLDFINMFLNLLRLFGDRNN